MPSSLDKVVLSWPTMLSLGDDKSAKAAKSSWMQVARTGDFVSSRYGKFSITRDDLAQMLHNFNSITPKAPTQIPVDYDHLSMDPKKPGDGMAAGWFKSLELRADGDELWGLVDWTPDAAKSITNRQYQFVSPSFVKDYVYKDGTNIGTTLLAAAITNHPFLEGMQALTLSGGLKELMGYMLSADSGEGKETPADEKAEHGGAMTRGQKVSIKDTEVQKAEQLGVTFTINDVVGEGADAFVSLLAPDGSVAEWFRADELQPAVVSPQPPQPQPEATPAATSATDPVVATPAVAPIQNMSTKEQIMKTFNLTDVNGQPVTVSEEALQALGLDAPEGAIVVKAADYESMQRQVVTLSDQVTVMAEAAQKAQRRAQIIELAAELDKLSKGAFITKPERTWAEETFGGDTVDLGGFKKWAATKTTPILSLHTEKGSGLDLTPNTGAEATDAIISLANEIATKQRIPFRDAVIKASKQLADRVETYREQFATS